MNDHHASDDALGARLQEAREYVGFSTEEVARYLGLSNRAISRMETGSRRPRDAELRSLAELYQTSVEFLVGHGQGRAGWESFPDLGQASADLAASDRNEILRFAQFLRSRGRDD